MSIISEVWEALGDIKGALSDYDEAIKLEPNRAVFYRNRGSLREAEGDRSGASKDYEQAKKLEPNS